jgi:hypothetical protein
MYHVTSSHNRASIEQHRLDVNQMCAATGCFPCIDLHDARWVSLT